VIETRLYEPWELNKVEKPHTLTGARQLFLFYLVSVTSLDVNFCLPPPASDGNKQMEAVTAMDAALQAAS